ncbi:hypothetical protein O181_113221 [Austropuccinia psidii MF-1]|uniref:Uncharacterized protein n=1 Tax=Austropuccinia psidii MF-1 TaxID=1389203 RepID=A0A9Q3K4I2_9BASI|nr:hypothetical protein [Austropuccinia psidii MF-1]
MTSYLQVNRLLGPEKTQELLKGWKLKFSKGKVKKAKALLKNKVTLSGDQKRELAQKKDNSHVEASQASTSKNPPQKVPNTGKKAPKKKAKQKQKGKFQVEQALPSELQNSKEGKGSYGKCIQ